LENNLDFVMLNEGCFRVSLRSKNWLFKKFKSLNPYNKPN
jgi:hypothetical protein